MPSRYLKPFSNVISWNIQEGLVELAWPAPFTDGFQGHVAPLQDAAGIRPQLTNSTPSVLPVSTVATPHAGQRGLSLGIREAVGSFSESFWVKDSPMPFHISPHRHLSTSNSRDGIGIRLQDETVSNLPMSLPYLLLPLTSPCSSGKQKPFALLPASPGTASFLSCSSPWTQ